jgi:hypothetical protein
MASSRPPVPRPVLRASSAPPPATAPAPDSTEKEPIPDSTPKQLVAIPKAYASEPPVIRERGSTAELDDDDIMEAAPVSTIRRRSTPPPPPLRKGSTLPASAQPARELPSTIPPSPDSSGCVAKAVIPPPPAVPSDLLDPAEVLFEGIYELDFVDTAWQAAGVCATALAKALGAKAVVIHTHDLETRQLKAVGTQGEGSFDVLGASEQADDDFVASTVICNGKPLTMRFDGELPKLAPRRLALMGAARTLVAVPAIAWGRCVAVIEVVDADERFADRTADSAAYVAERLAEFLSERAAA